MFGYIKPEIAELKVRHHELYKALYCGLCRAQRRHTGKLSALFLSYDFVFLYVLRAELTGTETSFSPRRSLFRRNCGNAADDNGQLRFCACAAALLNYEKLRDDLHDEGLLRRIGTLLLLPIARRGRKKAMKRLSLPADELSALMEKQRALERAGNASPEEAAECSGAIFALFASYGIGDELKAFAAERIGRALGMWLYLTDAADDLETDLKKKRYNPFSRTGVRRDDLLCSLDALCEQAELTLRALPVYDPGYRALLLNILTEGLHEQAKTVIFGNTKKNKGNL